ncbi:MAG: P-II family nitrogen regulator [Candidatus Methanoliparum thermophilum]|uniref:P-II family nitrogen regulator n=1 Tax=Methanoliparum thermophilum TaxID=2491083 RepID=A0A520KS72_METT2|nr:P-II family nitrogen regulator [Candidatus Methanoliparum sp. LAM-1]RZN64630.1 MAG: P-II family nitrogen regulator [Candidatus Methanoliparum thermophilum]BDC35745.1 nitrogen regulatory protein P-II [Candidatus Methanoliparum sp. LAM-1]
MKKIEAIVRVEKLDEIREALKEIGYPGMTITRVEGHGQQKGLIEQFRGREFKVELIPKIKIEVVASDVDADKIIKAITESAYTGNIGDGKIFVLPVEKAIRIRTGEMGDAAL